jgi:RHS repeat-associated protein
VALFTTSAAGEKTSFNLMGGSENTVTTKRYSGTGTTNRYYTYNKDIRTSTSTLVDDSGKHVLSYDYSDFGETTRLGNQAIHNEIAYTGGIYDADTKLYYLNARYYDPSDGRFITMDTARNGGGIRSALSLYGYCENNPIVKIDPSGHDALMLLDTGNNTVWQGHMGAAFFAKGAWWHYYYGPGGDRMQELRDEKGRFIWRAQKNAKGKRVSAWKRFLSSIKNYPNIVYETRNTYQKYRYFKGSFTASFNKAESERTRWDNDAIKWAAENNRPKSEYDEYDLLSRNCMDMAVMRLREGTFHFKKNSSVGNKSMKNKLKKVQAGTIIPNNAFKEIAKHYDSLIRKHKKR